MFNIYSELKRFCNTTSLKGVPRILKTRPVGLKAMWIAAVVTFLGVSGYQAYNLTTQFLRYPTVTVVREKGFGFVKSGQEVEMPNVLVCNLNPFAYSTTPRYSDIASLKEFHQRVMLMTTCNNCSSRRQALMGAIKDELLTYTGYYQYIGQDNVERISHTEENFIVSCQVDVLDGVSLGKTKCDGSVRVRRVTSSIYYNCYSLEIIKQTYSKMIMGFTLTLFLDNFDLQDHATYLNIASESGQARGALMTLTRPGAFPLIRKNGVFLSPGTLTDIKLSLELRKRLPPPHGTCSDTSGVPGLEQLANVSLYTSEGCLSYCTEELVEERCGCVDLVSLHVRHQASLDVPMCGSVNATPADFFTRWTCAKMNRTSGLFTECTKKCPTPCSELIYNFKTSSAGWPGNPVSPSFYKATIADRKYEWRFRGALSNDSQETSKVSQMIKENFLRFTVLLVNNRYIEFQDEPKFTFSTLVSQLGGSLNLWSGITMVVVVEFLELFIRLLFSGEDKRNIVSNGIDNTGSTMTNM